MLKKLTAIFILVAMVLAFNTSYASSTDDRPVIKDLSKAYEVWKNQGIKFVVRDDNGKFVTWNIGKLESWGTKSKWVVRDPKGRLLTHASGTVENWKNGMVRLVLRDKKGRILTHVGIDITDKSSFAATVVGLRRLKNDSFLSFVQDTLSDIILKELKQNELTKARVLVVYLNRYKNEKGAENFKPVLRKIIPVIHFMAAEKPDTKTKSLVEEARKLLAEL
jgi:hypothetical protein